MTADDLTRRAIIAAHDADGLGPVDSLTNREQAIVALWRDDRSSYYEIAEEGQGVAAAACDDRDEARAAIERVRAMPAEHPSGGWHMVSMRDVLAALDGTETPR